MRLAGLDQETRRKEYTRYVSLANIQSWKEENKESDDAPAMAGLRKAGLADKVSLFRGDITKLEVSFPIAKSKIFLINIFEIFQS